MRRAEWYVIQVETGRERKVCEVVRRACEDAKVLAGAAAADEIPGGAAPSDEITIDVTRVGATTSGDTPRDEAASDEAANDASPADEDQPDEAPLNAALAEKPLQEEGPTAEPILEECFSPTYEYRRKLRGEWVRQEMLLLPGYVIAVTRDPWELARVLRRTPAFTRLLAMGTNIVPLSANDRSWMERWTTRDDRTIPMSVAYKEGDAVVVTDGPLVGQEAMIVRVNRRKRVAHLEIHAGQLTIHTTAGLEVLPKPEGEP